MVTIRLKEREISEIKQQWNYLANEDLDYRECVDDGTLKATGSQKAIENILYYYNQLKYTDSVETGYDEKQNKNFIKVDFNLFFKEI